MLMHGSLNLDLAGIQFVEAWKHLCEGRKMYAALEPELKELEDILRQVDKCMEATDREDALVDIVQNIGTLEDSYSPVVSHLSLVFILLVSSAEAYINDVASYVLSGGELDHFDRLTSLDPTGYIRTLMQRSYHSSSGASRGFF